MTNKEKDLKNRINQKIKNAKGNRNELNAVRHYIDTYVLDNRESHSEEFISFIDNINI